MLGNTLEIFRVCNSLLATTSDSNTLLGNCKQWMHATDATIANGNQSCALALPLLNSEYAGYNIPSPEDAKEQLKSGLLLFTEGLKCLSQPAVIFNEQQDMYSGKEAYVDSLQVIIRTFANNFGVEFDNELIELVRDVFVNLALREDGNANEKKISFEQLGEDPNLVSKDEIDPVTAGIFNELLSANEDEVIAVEKVTAQADKAFKNATAEEKNPNNKREDRRLGTFGHTRSRGGCFGLRN